MGGVPDVVGGREAVIVPAEDPAALAGAVRALLADPGRAAERARAAAERLETEFAEEPWLRRYEEVYGAVLRGGRPAPGRSL